MGQQTKIEWCDHTFNPWRGCTKVSPGCEHCYAETLAKRNPGVLGIWGPNGTRVVASESYWKQPLKWDREAKEAGERRRVFCASMADVFEDRQELQAPREWLRWLMFETPHLDWLILTKRPEMAKQWIEDHIWQTNAWIGVSVEDQARADERIPKLLKIPAAVRFLSVEPLLGPIDIFGDQDHDIIYDIGQLDWVIIGGESGHGARPCELSWVRLIRDQCLAAGVACFIKQLGAHPVNVCRLALNDSKGGDWSEWPEDLRIRQFPR